MRTNMETENEPTSFGDAIAFSLNNVKVVIDNPEPDEGEENTEEE